MKILMVNDAATPLGGAEHLTLALRDGYRRRGHEAELFASDYGKSAGDCRADTTCRSFTGPVQGLTRVWNPWALSALRKTIKRFEPDIVHVRMFLTQLSPAIMRVLRGRPHVFHATDYMMVCPTGHKMLPDGRACDTSAGAVCRQSGCVSTPMYVPIRLQMRMTAKGLPRAGAIIANSHNTAEILQRDGVGPARVIWNGCEPLDQRPPLDGPPQVVCVSRLEREKGVHILIEAFGQVAERVPEATLLIAGEGSQRGVLERRVAELGLTDRVTFLGRVQREAQGGLFAKAWVQVAPSLWREPFGNVAVEAAMRGTAAIVTGGGLAEIVIDGRTGYVVPMGDAGAMADRLLLLLSDRDLAERMGQQGRDRAMAEFTLDTMIDRTLDLYQELLNDN